MDSKNVKKKVMIVVSLVLVVLIALTATLFVVFGRKNKGDDSDENAENMSNSQITFSKYFKNHAGNASIMKNELSTSNYMGSYQLSKVTSIEFNEWSESNKGGLTEENIQTLIENSGTKNRSGFNNLVYNRRKEKADTFNIYFKTSDDKHEYDYGTFTATSSNNSYKTIMGKVYGDENLAIIRFLEDTDTNNFFIRNNSSDELRSVLYISLNYGSLTDATGVSDSTKTKESVIYVFEDVYSENNPNLKLFTVTYAYKCVVPTSPSIPDSYLGF